MFFVYAGLGNSVMSGSPAGLSLSNAVLSGNLDAAESMINTASQQESGNPEVYKEKALISETKGDKIRAIEGYNQYLLLAPNAADRAQVEGRIRNLSM